MVLSADQDNAILVVCSDSGVHPRCQVSCYCCVCCRYYRSVVCALALAATASLRAQGSSSNSTQAAATLHLQAAKVSQGVLIETFEGILWDCTACHAAPPTIKQ